MMKRRISMMLGLLLTFSTLAIFQATSSPVPLQGEETTKENENKIPTITIMINGEEFHSNELEEWIETELEDLKIELEQVDSTELKTEIEETLQEVSETRKTIVDFLKSKIKEHKLPAEGAKLELRLEDVPEILQEIFLGEEEEEIELFSEEEKIVRGRGGRIEREEEYDSRRRGFRGNDNDRGRGRGMMGRTLQLDNRGRSGRETRLGGGRDEEGPRRSRGRRPDDREFQNLPPEPHALEQRMGRLLRAAELLQEAGEVERAEELMIKVQELEEEMEQIEGDDMSEERFLEELMQEMRGIHKEIHDLRKEVQELKELLQK